MAWWLYLPLGPFFVRRDDAVALLHALQALVAQCLVVLLLLLAGIAAGIPGLNRVLGLLAGVALGGYIIASIPLARSAMRGEVRRFPIAYPLLSMLRDVTSRASKR